MHVVESPLHGYMEDVLSAFPAAVADNGLDTVLCSGKRCTWLPHFFFPIGITPERRQDQRGQKIEVNL